MKVAVLAAVLMCLLAGCSSGKTKHPSPSTSSAAGKTCVSLVGQRMSVSDMCVVPVVGLSAPKSFPCYADNSTFYYFHDGPRYVFGKIGGMWMQDQYTESLGPIATDLGC